MNRETLIASLAAVACGIGIVLTADSMIQAPPYADLMKRKQADIERLLALQRDRSRDLAAVEMFNQLPAKTPAPIGDLLSAALPGSHPTIRQRETRPTAEGWTLRSVEVSFDSVKLSDLARFLAKAEEARPPWRLTEFNATALEQTPASANLSVVLEALEKKVEHPLLEMRGRDMNILRTISERRELVANLVSRELKSKYKGSMLGFLWSILTPLFMAVIYVFFLRLLAGRGVPVESIIIGVFAWQFTALCVTGGMTCVSGNSNLVKKVYFPRIILPLANTLANLVNFLLSLAVQFVILFILLGMRGTTVSPWALAVPVLIVYHTLFNLGLALLMSSSNVYFRDTQHLAGVLLSAWFFVSPVMYDLSFVERAAPVSPLLTNLYMLNPMAVIITGYRAMTMPGEVFPWTPYTVAGLLLPLVLLWIGYVVFQRSEKNFADML